jgi:hypothetical protein
MSWSPCVVRSKACSQMLSSYQTVLYLDGPASSFSRARCAAIHNMVYRAKIRVRFSLRRSWRYTSPKSSFLLVWIDFFGRSCCHRASSIHRFIVVFVDWDCTGAVFVDLDCVAVVAGLSFNRTSSSALPDSVVIFFAQDSARICRPDPCQCARFLMAPHRLLDRCTASTVLDRFLPSPPLYRSSVDRSLPT